MSQWNFQLMFNETNFVKFLEIHEIMGIKKGTLQYNPKIAPTTRWMSP